MPFFNRKVSSYPWVLLPQLGAVRLDRDIRAVVGYLSSQTVFGNAREKFQRLFQVSTLLNLDAVSVLWYYRMRGENADCLDRMRTLKISIAVLGLRGS